MICQISAESVVGVVCRVWEVGPVLGLSYIPIELNVIADPCQLVLVRRWLKLREKG